MTDETQPATPAPKAANDEAPEPIGPADLGAGEIGSGPTLDSLAAEAADWRDKAMRAAAEVENIRRRAEREKNDARAYAIERFARDLLEAADTLDRAVKAAPEDGSDAVRGFVTGVEMTEKKLQTAFEKNGLKKLDPAPGEKFDPHLHQAMMEQPGGEVPPGAVIQTLQSGYELFGRVVRPAMVVVAAKG